MPTPLEDKITALEAELAEILAAISKARKAVTVGAAGKNITRDYKTLMLERNSIESKIQRLKLKKAGNSSSTFQAADLGGF